MVGMNTRESLMASTSQNMLADPGRHRGPSLVAVATTYVVLFMTSLIASTAMAGGQHFPSVFSPPSESSRYFADHAMAVQLMALLQFGAAVPLGIFAATATSRLQFIGMKVAGISIAFFGGISASACLMFSAFVEWTLSQPGAIESDGVTRALHLLCFAAGGPGYVVPFGILVAGVSLVAGLQRFVPRWLMVLGLVIAVVAELSTLVLVIPAAGYLLPLARFSGFAWMICVGALLPKSKSGSRVRSPTEDGELTNRRLPTA
jgi:hypothetical protein